MLACGKASTKHRLPSAANRPVSAVCQYELIGGMLIFIAFWLGIDNHNLADNAFPLIIGDTVFHGENSLVKRIFCKLGSGKLHLCLHSVKEYLHGFQIIVRADGFRCPRNAHRIVVGAVAHHKGVLFLFIHAQDNLFIPKVDAVFHLIRANHSFFLTHSAAPFSAFFLFARLKSFGYRHRRK